MNKIAKLLKIAHFVFLGGLRAVLHLKWLFPTSDLTCLNFFQPGQTSCLTHLDWSSDSTYLQSNSGDYELLYCKLLAEKITSMSTNYFFTTE
jgi:hypothetical protein